MTRPPTPNSCDICQEEIDPSQMSYTAQFSQKQPYRQGLKTQNGNYKVQWKTMMKDEKTDKWITVDPQQKLEE